MTDNIDINHPPCHTAIFRQEKKLIFRKEDAVSVHGMTDGDRSESHGNLDGMGAVPCIADSPDISRCGMLLILSKK